MSAGRLIAMGDIHGCAAALVALLDTIQPGPNDTLVTLGDYIDRGPDSKGVLDLLLQWQQRCHLVTLRGNHEDALLMALDHASDRRFWLGIGGRQALDSYGIVNDEVRRIPAEHFRLLRDCGDYYETVNHIFLHSYYEPHLPLVQQPWSSLRWVFLPRQPEPHCSGKIAVVGHTPQRSGEILDLGFLKAIDTNCCGGGWLTALEVQTGQVWQANQQGQLRMDQA